MAKATKARSTANRGKGPREKTGPSKAASKTSEEKRSKVTSIAAASKERKPVASEPRLAGLMGRLRQFMRDVRGELRKVTWPSRKQLLASTAAVLVAILVLAIYIGLLDYAFRGIAKYLNL